MKKDASENSVGGVKASPGKKTYAQPKLREFGKLHLLTQGTGANNGDGGQTMMTAGSDRAIKEHIVLMGTHPLGISLYLFAYKAQYRDLWGHGKQLGVMADEVEAVLPEAVSVHPDGYKMVDYAMLRSRPTLQ